MKARGETSGRSDDVEEIQLQRIETYMTSTEPIIKYYQENYPDKIVEIDATGTIDEVYELTKAQIPRTVIGGDFEDASQLEDISTFFTKEADSSLKRNLTADIWRQYKDKSDDAGVSFKTMIFSGIKNQDSGIGLYAGSHSSYFKFYKLFDKVIQEYHGHAPEDKHESNMNSRDLKNYIFVGKDAEMVQSTRIRVGRNCKGYPLGPGVTKEQRLEIMNKVVKACNTFTDDLKGKFYPLEGMSQEDQKQLIDDHFLFKEGDRFL